MTATQQVAEREAPTAADPRPARAATRSGDPGRFTLLAMRIGVGFLILGVWWLVSRTSLIRPSLNQSPKDVWDAIIAMEEKGLLWSNLGATLSAAAVALVLAGTAGTVAGLALGLLPRTELVLAPYISAVNAMPRVALAPVFIIFFGIGMGAKVALAFTVVFFMFVLNTHAGVRSCDPDVARLMRVMGASKLERFFKVLLPVAVPQIIAATRLGIVYSLLGVVTSELISSQDGMGQMIAMSSSTYDLATVYGSLIVIAIAAAVLDLGAKIAERRLLRWDPEIG